LLKPREELFWLRGKRSPWNCQKGHNLNQKRGKGGEGARREGINAGIARKGML